MSENKRYRVFKYIDYERYGVSDDIAEYTLATFDNHIEAECFCDRLNEQEETIQNQKKYILLLKRKLEEYGIRLEPKDYD